MQKIKNLSSILIKGTFAVSVANAGAQIINVLLLPIYSIYLTPKDYGIFAMVSLIITFLALLYNPGMMSATTRLYHTTEIKHERETLIGSAFLFFLLIPIIPIFIGLFYGQHIFNLIFSELEFFPYGFLALLLAFFIQPSKTWTVLMSLEYKLHKTAIYLFLSVILGSLVSIILVVFYKMGAMGKILGMFPSSIFLFIVSYVTIKRYCKGKWSFDSIKKQLVFGLPMVGGLWAFQGLSFIGKYLLELLSSIESVGYYSFASTLSNAPMFLILGFKQMWSPIFYENMNNKNYATINKLTEKYITYLSLLFLLFILFNKELVIILINDSYHQILPIMGIIGLAVYFNGLLTLSNTYISYKNNFGKISLFALIAVILNIILNILLIPQFDYLGSAISLAISYFIFFLLGVIYQKRNYKNIIKQSKMVSLFPILYLFVCVLVTYSFSFLDTNYSINFFEIMLKLSLLILFIIILFKNDHISKSDFILLKKRNIN